MNHCPTCDCQADSYQYFSVFTLGGRFGKWAEEHIQTILPQLVRPTSEQRGYTPDGKRANTNPFDFFYPKRNLRIEVKAARVVPSTSNTNIPLWERALDSKTKTPYQIYFRHLKKEEVDMFIWLAFWRDQVRYWMVPSSELNEEFPFKLSSIQRGEQGKEVIISSIKLNKLEKYETTPVTIINDLDKLIKNPHQRVLPIIN